MLVLVLLASSVSAQDQPTTLRIGRTYVIDTLNPASSYFSYQMRALWYDTLIQFVGGDRVAPGLAESWSVSDDELTWTFKIRPGVTFADGTPLTAVEAAWSLNWTIENQLPTLITYLNNVTSAEAPDPTTLLIHVSQPVPDMISAKLLYVWMLPPSVWADKTGDDITTYNELDAAMGSGPYHLTEYQEGEYTIMEANPNYWGGKPPVDKIIYQQYATEDALVQALLAGDLDFILEVPTSGVATLENEPKITISIEDDFYLEELIINSNPDGTQPASLNDPQIRLAIAHAIDKQQIINVGYFGYAAPANSVLPAANGRFHNDQIPGISYDLDEANRILDEAGYVDTNGDGIREYSDGTPLEYRFYTSESYAYYARIVEIISHDLAAIGISAPPQALSDDSLIALQVDYDSDLIYWGWYFDPDPGSTMSIFICGETVDGGWSDSGYCNPEYDRLYQEQTVTTDEETRLQIIWQMQQMIADDKPYIPVVYQKAISAFRNDRFQFPPDVARLSTKYALFNGF
ncbi:MAG: ABC transporter substrate-binding protein [Anaerolineae bacterium]|nr:ABC transporter substrate-binding protein [Anaerolineae bacterium]